MSQWPHDGGWLRRHPLPADMLLSVVVLVATLLPFAVDRQSQMLTLEPRGFLILTASLASAILVFRRRYPWSVWTGTVALGLAAVAASGGPTSAYIPAIVALFTVTTRVTAARALVPALFCAVMPVVLSFGRHGAFDAVAFGMTAWSGVALMSGIAVRSQRAVIASAHERARLAEAGRDEEAERRVTEERVRIARELHDVVAHHVAVINVQAGVASHLVGSDPERAAVAMSHVREASQSVLHEVSEMLGLLRSRGEEPETGPLPRLAEIDILVERARHSGVSVVWQTTGAERELLPTVDLTAYRVLQESLTNAARHGTGSVVVQVDFLDDALAIEVRNKRAAPTSRTPKGRHGLAGMRERVAAVGGTLTAGAGDPGSWVVSARLPLPPLVGEPSARVL